LAGHDLGPERIRAALQGAYRVNTASSTDFEKHTAPVTLRCRNQITVRQPLQVPAAKPAAGQLEIGTDSFRLIPVQKDVITAARHTTTPATGAIKPQWLSFVKWFHDPALLRRIAAFIQYHRVDREHHGCPQEKTLSHKTKPVFEGRVVRLGIESLTLPNGEPLELEIVRHPGGAAVVALNENQQVCLLRQFRHAAGGWLWELPAGKLDKNEEPQAAAARELAEEAGLRARHWQPLGEVLMTPGFCDEVIHLFLARELAPVAAHPERHELIEIHWMPFSKTIEQVHDGTIHDAKTMLGLLLAASYIHP